MNILINNADKADIFAGLFQHIKLFTEHINIMFESERMYLQAMDSSRVSVFEIELPNYWFDKYELSQNISIGINATILFKVLNARDKRQTVSLTYKEDIGDILYIDFNSENKEIFNKQFEIPLMEIECEMMGIPDIESQADFTLNSISFASIIGQLQMFGDTLQFNCSEEEITLCSTSQETGKMTVNISMEDIDSFAINDGETVNLSFSLSYLHNICMYAKMAKDVEIKLTREYPMKLTYLLGDEKSKITFYLAPKINDDE